MGSIFHISPCYSHLTNSKSQSPNIIQSINHTSPNLKWLVQIDHGEVEWLDYMDMAANMSSFLHKISSIGLGLFLRPKSWSKHNPNLVLITSIAFDNCKRLLWSVLQFSNLVNEKKPKHCSYMVKTGFKHGIKLSPIL